MLDISEITYFQLKKTFCLDIPTLERYLSIHEIELWHQCALVPLAPGPPAVDDTHIGGKPSLTWANNEV